MCVSGCPYKKVYFNHKTGTAEKCTLCYPRLEVGQPTVCSETFEELVTGQMRETIGAGEANAVDHL